MYRYYYGDGTGSTATPPSPSSQASTYASAVLALSPVGYFKMDEASGTTMYDTSSNGNDGTYTGSPTLGVSGPFSGATGVTFDGSTNYASAAHHADYDWGTSDFSYVLWVYVGATWPTGSEFFIGHGGDGRSTEWDGYCVGNLDNKVRSRIAGTTVSSDQTTDISTAGWHMLALCADRSGNATWYVDNVNNGATDISAGVATDISYTSPLYLARRTSTAYFAGSLCQVSLHDSLLSSSDVDDLWTAAGF